MSEKTFDIEKIIEKIKTGKDLTKEENIFYLMKAFGHSKEEALNIIAIVDNKDRNLIID